jgi:YggT family protein
VRIVADVLNTILWLYLLVLMFRLVMDFVFQLARSYRPHGLMLVALEVTYTLTDPPLKAIRRVIPPLRLGGVSIDLAFLILLFIIYILRGIVAAL